MNQQNSIFVPFPVKFECSKSKKQEILYRFKKNLEFFKKNLPDFYKDIEENLKNINKIDILLKVFENDYDLIFNKVSIYPKGAKNYKLPFKRLTSFISPKNLKKQPGVYFHSLVVVDTIRKVLNLLEDKPKKHNVFTLFFIAGLGLGLYLEKFLEENFIKDLVILEDEFPIFLASLFTLDWEKIYKYQAKRGNFRLVINKGYSEENFERFSLLLKVILDFYPYRGSLAAYGQHYKYPGFESIVKTLLTKYFTFTKGFGFYDDERLAINNATFIYKNKYKYLKDITEKQISDLPVVLIGSGPSLGKNIEDIKKLQDKAIIVACGSALASLYKYGIKPDIFINMERVPSVKNIFKEIPEEFLEDILFFTTDNTHPDVFKYFKKENTYIYPRGGSAPAFLTRPKYLILCSPVVVNAAFDLFFSLGFRNFILIGVDMGTKYLDKFHDSKSIYDKNYDKNLIDKNRVLPGNFGGVVYTNETMFWSKATLELQILERLKKGFNLKVFNMSDGAKVEHTTPIKNFEELKNYLIFKNSKTEIMSQLLKFFTDNYKQIFNPWNKNELLNVFLKFKDAVKGVLNTANNYTFEEVLSIADNVSKLIFELPEALKSIFLGTIILGLSNIIGYYTFIKDDFLEEKYFRKVLNEYTLNLEEVFLDFITNLYPKIEEILNSIKK